MYEMTLTASERQAFDWVGGRYAAGNVADLLRGCDGGDRWNEEGDIAFRVPEHVAWAIREHAEAEDFAWPCFAPPLVRTLNAFCDSIV